MVELRTYGNNTFTRKTLMRYYFFGLLSVLMTVFSCGSDDFASNVGSNFLDNDININLLDTFSINSSTFKLDEVNTSSTGRILLGHIENHIDDGDYLTASAYLELSRSEYSAVIGATYDSIGLVLNYDENYYYGDTAVALNYKVYQLDTPIANLEDEDGNYSNNSGLTPSAIENLELIGEIKDFFPRPNRANDSIYISLNESLGNTIFDKIQDAEITSEDEFQANFRGLVIVPSNETSSQILGFNVSASENSDGNSSMRIFYTPESTGDDDDDDDALSFFDFVVTDGSVQFNNITTGLSETPFAEIEDTGTQVYSTETDNKTYIQGGSGICAKVEIPGLNKIKGLSEFGSTLSAELIFNPSPGSFNNDFPLPDALDVYAINPNNDLIQEDPIGTATLIRNSEFIEDTFYSIDLTTFVQLFIESDEDVNFGLMFQIQSFNENVNRVAIDDRFANSSQLKLTVKYLNF